MAETIGVTCLLLTYVDADELLCVDLRGGRFAIKKTHITLPMRSFVHLNIALIRESASCDPLQQSVYIQL